MESSRRDLFNDTTKHESTLKSIYNVYQPNSIFTPKMRYELPQTWDSYFTSNHKIRTILAGSIISQLVELLNAYPLTRLGTALLTLATACKTQEVENFRKKELLGRFLCNFRDLPSEVHRKGSGK